jgi:hypothetical protein
MIAGPSSRRLSCGRYSLVACFMIWISSCGVGYVTSVMNMNRSSWASGSGYVPSCSIGFWVASTKNGSGSSYVVSPR